MRFTFEEAEFLNAFFNEEKIESKEEIVNSLKSIKVNDYPLMREFLTDTINKVITIDEEKLLSIFSSLPIISFVNY